jgi:type VI protein secretion system component Hcp
MAFDAYLELTQGGRSIVHGETLDKVMKPGHAMELTSFTLASSVDLSDSTTRASMGSKSVFSIKCKKLLDIATPSIFQAFCRQSSRETKSFDAGKIVCRKAAGHEQMEFLIFEFKEVTIANWKLETNDDHIPDESFDLYFTKLTVTYIPQKAGGLSGTRKPAGWDFSTPGKIT